MNTVVYPGSFDPFTLGHLNIVERGLQVFDHIVITCNRDDRKGPLFSAEERVAMLHEIFAGRQGVEIAVLDGLLVDFLKERRISTILRGIRTVEDFEYEYQMTFLNRMLDATVETVFMLTEGNFGHLSSSFIKEIASLGGDVSAMVPPPVEAALKKRFASQ